MLHSSVSKERGFTTLELAIVMAIVGIFVAIGMPSLIAAIHHVELARATDLVVTSLQESQRAVTRQSKSCMVTLDKARNKIVGDDGCLLSGDRHLPDAISLDYTGSDGYIRYGIRGNTTTNKSVILKIKDSPNNSRCLTISAPLGIIRLGSYDDITHSCRKLNT